MLAISKELGFFGIPLDTQRLSGEKVSNPHLIENSKGVLINAVARSIIVGYDKDGNPMLTTAGDFYNDLLNIDRKMSKYRKYKGEKIFSLFPKDVCEPSLKIMRRTAPSKAKSL